ncbi:hypothetical protein NHX12_014143 [Muraenolepis orangiensis]|uniref:Amine oxidase domain-containing protein n=1 Tax=Muraenolepis orangiensis TaxID=630683 RepID=A0A9Q0DAV1_9TELE|nr:hypothetical protein NHX12_014143 [Muraenolepis orangiensis]
MCELGETGEETGEEVHCLPFISSNSHTHSHTYIATVDRTAQTAANRKIWMSGMTFRVERFWVDDGIKGGKSITDRPSRFIYYPSHRFPENPDIGVLLASYTWSDDSLPFLGMGDEELKEVALTDLVLIHGDQVRDLCTGVVVKKWSSDPYSLGAFARFTPYQHIDFATELFKYPISA